MAKKKTAPARLSDRIRAARKDSGHKQAEFARLAGFDVRSLWRWENSDIQPRAEALSKIARVAGVRLEWLVTGAGAMRSRA